MINSNSQTQDQTKQLWATMAELSAITGFDRSECLEALREAQDTQDFELNNWRFIHTAVIDNTLEAELSNDDYTLGCFNDGFLADVLNIDSDVIKAMQDAEAFEAVGKLIISLGKLEELAEQYVMADGYGHHFAVYDFNEYTLRDWHIFRVG